MSRDEYETMMQQVLLMGSLVRDWDIQGALDQIGHADSIGIMLDPTAWKRGQKNMHDYESLLRALMPFKAAVLKLAHSEVLS